MPVPSLSPQQRADALGRAVAARGDRARVRQQLKQREITLTEVLDEGTSDGAISRMRVSSLVESMPGVGPATATTIMEELGIAASRRVRGLGPHQRTALLERFTRA